MDNIRIEERGNLLCASLSGRLAQAESEDLFRRVSGRLAGKAGVVLDLSQVQYMSSSAVGAVVSLCQQVRLAGGRMAVAAPDERVHTLLEVAGLNQLMELCRTVEEAAAAVEGGKPA
jgi:anti-sigma B factor antagonist